MVQNFQLINITPDEFKNSILEGVQQQIDLLRAEFQPKEPTEYMTRQEVKDLLKIDLSTLHYWTKKGKLISYGIGNRVYYKRSDVEASLIRLNK